MPPNDQPLPLVVVPESTPISTNHLVNAVKADPQAVATYITSLENECRRLQAQVNDIGKEQCRVAQLVLSRIITETGKAVNSAEKSLGTMQSNLEDLKASQSSGSISRPCVLAENAQRGIQHEGTLSNVKTFGKENRNSAVISKGVEPSPIVLQPSLDAMEPGSSFEISEQTVQV